MYFDILLILWACVKKTHCVPPVDGELTPAATCQPVPEIKRTELTLAPEEEIQQESDQECEPTTSADEETQSTDHKDWLIDFSEETLFPTLSQSFLSFPVK